MRISITDFIHQELQRFLKPGGVWIDATVGKGNDTLFLCQQLGPNGIVIGFDIQQMAIDMTRETVRNQSCQVILHHAGHEMMGEYIEKESVDGILFNLGYLPTGDHKIQTKKDTTIQAIREGLLLLKVGGVMSICIYSGGDSGFEERDAVLEYLKCLDDKKYFVVVQNIYNKKHHPPLPVLIQKIMS